MNFRLLAGLIFLGGASSSDAQPAETPALNYGIEEIASPAGPGLITPVLTRGPDGTVWLLWRELGGNNPQVQCATFDNAAGRWGKPRTVVASEALVLNVNEPPAITVGANGHLVVASSTERSGPRQLLISRSSDYGVSWSSPTPLTKPPATAGFPALATLADGRVLITWLGRTAPSAPTTLFARILDGPNSIADTPISSAVNETSAPALTAFPDGSALLSYRGRSTENVIDPHTARFTAAGWSEPRALNVDSWRLKESHGFAPQLASDGPRVSAAWFTAADNQPRVLFSTSADAGEHFLLPMKADLGRAFGPVDTVLLHDGAALVTWMEGPSKEPRTHPGGVWIRRASPQATLDPAILVAIKNTDETSQLRAVLLQDYSETNPEARLLIAYSGADGLHTLRVTIPEAALLAAATESCGCGGAPAQLTGFPFRGTLVTPLAAEGILVAQHPALPGLLPAGTHRFRATPGVMAAVTPGQEFIGHIEQRFGEWWLFDLRVLVAPPPKPLSQP